LYRWVEHTSEAELEIEGESAADVLVEATAAFGDLLSAAPRFEEAEVRARASAGDLPALLAEWLGELAYLAETDGFIAERVVGLDLAGTAVEALVAGHRSEPQSLVKGVTYHRLEMAPEAGLWREGEMVVKADLPGVKPDEINVELEEGVLTVSGEHEEKTEEKGERFLRRERRYGSFSRSMALPAGVDPDAIEANTTDGVLELRVPLLKPEEKPTKTIKVESKGG
jgi:HSP20 family protein